MCMRSIVHTIYKSWKRDKHIDSDYDRGLVPREVSLLKLLVRALRYPSVSSVISKRLSMPLQRQNELQKTEQSLFQSPLAWVVKQSWTSIFVLISRHFIGHFCNASLSCPHCSTYHLLLLKLRACFWSTHWFLRTSICCCISGNGWPFTKDNSITCYIVITLLEIRAYFLRTANFIWTCRSAMFKIQSISTN